MKFIYKRILYLLIMESIFDISKIEPLFKNLGKTDELEIMFNNYKDSNKLTMEEFIRVTKMIKLLSKKDKKPIKQTISLDVVYSENSLIKYRVTIEGLTKINQILNLIHQRSNNIALTVLLSKLNGKDVTVMKKTKDMKMIYDQDNLDIRFRKSKEEELTKKELDKISSLSSDFHSSIHYRFKNRLSYIIKTSVGDLSIDLTMAQHSQELKNVKKSNTSYEIEAELYPSKTVDKKGLIQILEKISDIKKVIAQNVVLKGKLTNEQVIQKYNEIVYKDTTGTGLYSMKPISSQVQHLIDKIPNQYSATDKADGKHHMMFITDGELFLIDDNFGIRDTGMKMKGLDNTIIDGELIFLPKQQVFLMMNFDILFASGKNIMNISNLKERITIMIDTINQMTGNKESLVSDYEGTFNLQKIRQHYQKQIKNFYDDLDKQIQKANKGDIIIKPKLFLFPTGGSPTEAFMFADLIWESCTEIEDIKCPYMLDGIIYTGMEQKYTASQRDTKLPIYKFKPPSQNSLDVYLTFPKNSDTGDYLEIYDNSDDNKVKDQVYRIANFYVGDKLGNKEVPVPFMKEDNNHEGFFPIIKGQVRDVEGDIIQDKTVVEITYDNDPTLPHQYRWKILRTRWDKTDSVNKFQKKYGNFRTIAINVWKSMKESVTWDEIKALANPESYDKQLKQLQGRIDSTVISTDRAQDAYYQKVTNLCKPMRNFHNWIKTNIITLYCSPKKSLRNGKQEKLKVLDFGAGRAGDLMKIYHARVGYYVGIEPNYSNLYNTTDGAIVRYNKEKSKFPDFTNMKYLQADAGVEFIGEKQKQRLGNMKLGNLEAIDKEFSKKHTFDLVMSMLAIHYLFADDSTLDIMCKNLNDNLKPGGFIMFTLFDGNKIHKLFDKDNTYTSWYTDEEGKRTKLFEIIKKYDGDNLNRTGLPIDVHMAWISEEGKYETEYVVTPEFMIKTMKDKCGAELVETDTFENMYYLNKPWFETSVKVEANLKNRKFYQNAYQFYGDLKGADKESKKYSFLFRYFIFQKKY